MKDNEKGMDIDRRGEPVREQEQDSMMEEYGEDEEFIRDMFDQDGIEVPESLSAENIEKKLEKAGPESDVSSGRPLKVTVRKHVWWKYAGTAAAVCACLLLVLMPVLNAGKADPFTDITEGESELTSFKSYREINKVLDKMMGTESGMLYKNAELEEGDMAVQDSAESGYVAGDTAPKAGASSDDSGAGHSETYLQVKGVDEADRVKCDDKYLYYISSDNKYVYICRADRGRTKRAAEIKAPEDKFFSDMFLDGDRLITITGGYWGFTETEVTVYDISDRAKPKKTAAYTQSGSPVSQRMADGVVYLVTDRYADGRDIPYCGASGKTAKLEPEDICCVPNPVSPEYTVIGAVDVRSGKELSHVTKAVLGGSQDIYASGDNLYVAGQTYIKDKNTAKEIIEDDMTDRIYPFYSGTSATVIIKVRIADGDISLEKTAVVKGMIDDQFSMDEKDGNFRIATTSSDEDGRDINNMFVLDKNLKLLGKVSGFAKGESIKAVRYVKDKAYVITYEQTDPLFVIDLSDSRNPKIEGEVKIDGFSTLLVPLSEDRLLGIGYGVKAVETWQETSGLKFVIFDISNPSKPKVVTSMTRDGIFSSVQDDHRGLVVLGEGENARFVLPCWKEYEEYAVDYDDNVEVYDDAESVDPETPEYEPAEPEGETDDSGSSDEYRGGAMEIVASDDNINILDYHKTKEAVSRCPVIQGYIYAICDNDEIESFRLK